MRRCLIAIGAVATLAAATAPAEAGVRPLSARPGAAPVIAGPDVVFSRPSGRSAIALRAVAGTRGPARSLGRVSVPRRSGRIVEWVLGGGRDVLAIRIGASARARNLVFAGRAPGGPFARLAGPPPLGGEPGDVGGPAWPVATGVLTEGGSRSTLAVRTFDGRTRPVALPKGAESFPVDAAGATLAVAIQGRGGLRSVALVNLVTGATRTIAPGPLRGDMASDLVLGDDGSVALGLLGGAIAYAAPGAGTFTTVATRQFADALAVGGGRIAMVTQSGLPNPGQRVIVLRPRPGSTRAVVEYRGPRATRIEGLGFDGSRAVWATEGCQVVSDTDRSSSAPVLPRGPCVRTEAEGLPERRSRVHRGRYLRLRVGCVAAPTRTCRVRVRARDVRDRSLGVGAARIRVGREANVRIPVRGAALRRARRDVDDLGFDLKMVDPDGRSRIELVPGG